MGPNQPTAAVTPRPGEDVASQQAYLTVARRLRQLNQPICGLWPVDTQVGFEDVPRRLASALASLGTTAAIVDRPARWQNVASQTSLLASALGEGVDLLTPVWTRTPDLGTAVEQILTFIDGRYECVLLDLTGLDLVGAHDVGIVPGVAIVLLVARGRISESSLAKIRRRLPPHGVLGVVLVDVEPTPGAAIA
jgi:hypothetical protein